ncbi:MAG: hypothetical protein ACREX0_08935, partial [Noviherbaspirillum sp.]
MLEKLFTRHAYRATVRPGALIKRDPGEFHQAGDTRGAAMQPADLAGASASVNHTIMPDRLFRHALIVLFLCALALLYIGQYTNLDLQLADWMVDRGRQVFAWKDDWFAAVFMHQWMKYLFILVGLVLTGALLVDALASFRLLAPATRRRLAVVALASLMVPLVISLLKSSSVLHCPWDLARYGG